MWLYFCKPATNRPIKHQNSPLQIMVLLKFIRILNAGAYMLFPCMCARNFIIEIFKYINKNSSHLIYMLSLIFKTPLSTFKVYLYITKGYELFQVSCECSLQRQRKWATISKWNTQTKCCLKIHVEIIPLHGLKKYFSYNHLTDHMQLVSCKLIQIKCVTFQKHIGSIMCKLFQIMFYVLKQHRAHNL